MASRSLVSASLLAIAALLVATGYLLGTRSSPGIAGAISEPAGNGAVPASDIPSESAAAPSGMNQAAFWGLIVRTRADADNDTGRQSGLLEERLSKLPPRQIVRFEQIRRQMDERLYTWDVWGAAVVINHGCSDDCFRDFRAYLISLGPRAFAAALRKPDSLAPVVQNAEQGDWENADDVAPDAYQSRTGDDFPADSSDLSGNPRGQSWRDESRATLVQRYPALAARFR
ncbi:MAG TPA: DUF4240 domain-containing protein [Thermoleophilaceae bacterium]